jgi:hypothetical protein
MDSKYPFLAGTVASAKGDAETSAAPVPGSITSNEDLTHLNDADLYKIFTRGVADMPSNMPGEQGTDTDGPTHCPPCARRFPLSANKLETLTL